MRTAGTRLGRWEVLSLVLGVCAAPCAPAQSLSSPTYTLAQAALGQAAYRTNCAACHGDSLDDGRFAVPLRGSPFLRQWGSRTVDELFIYTRSKMPPTGPGTLGDAKYAQILAYLLQQNRLPPGTSNLPVDPQQLSTMVLPPVPPGAGGAVPANVRLPPPPPHISPLAAFTAVTDRLLDGPPGADWLTWRRTQDAQGFSPLGQITRRNVAGLRIAWTWSLPNGPNEATPLVHDGVLFVYSFGDRLQALDAATGDLLWQYNRRLPSDAPPSWKHSISLYGNALRTYLGYAFGGAGRDHRRWCGTGRSVT